MVAVKVKYRKWRAENELITKLNAELDKVIERAYSRLGIPIIADPFSPPPPRDKEEKVRRLRTLIEGKRTEIKRLIYQQIYRMMYLPQDKWEEEYEKLKREVEKRIEETKKRVEEILKR